MTNNEIKLTSNYSEDIFTGINTYTDEHNDAIYPKCIIMHVKSFAQLLSNAKNDGSLIGSPASFDHRTGGYSIFGIKAHVTASIKEDIVIFI